MNKLLNTAALVISASLCHAAMASEASHELTLTEADKLITLPLHCVETPYPYKTGIVLGSADDLKEPAQHHPIFYGCFDWHSAAHGYWSLVTLLRQFPEMEHANEARAILERNLTAENGQREAAFFSKDINKSFERTYGWAWLLKLSDELKAWDGPKAAEYAANLQPLVDVIVQRYMEFLPQLLYPVRVGEHSNTAFGLSFAHDYAVNHGLTELQELIEARARNYFSDDENCPISWEPSGYDFISPCLEEIGLMQRVLPADEFLPWLQAFMPQLADKDYSLAVGKVSDRSDGKLVHLDGLNFSRAWNLYALANAYPQYAHLRAVADQHMAYSYPNLIGDSYEGGHWLGSFAIQALNSAVDLRQPPQS
ncbi:DUF2891 domain-containing protein [Pseudidiomarina salilacus]|uniref:DUF2891 domain-containing protein n=1 Tax=Pseudidiomarina salilacus TaxID=3384452 RepID=UPI00398475FF